MEAERKPQGAGGPCNVTQLQAEVEKLREEVEHHGDWSNAEAEQMREEIGHLRRDLAAALRVAGLFYDAGFEDASKGVPRRRPRHLRILPVAVLLCSLPGIGAVLIGIAAIGGVVLLGLPG